MNKQLLQASYLTKINREYTDRFIKSCGKSISYDELLEEMESRIEQIMNPEFGFSHENQESSEVSSNICNSNQVRKAIEVLEGWDNKKAPTWYASCNMENMIEELSEAELERVWEHFNSEGTNLKDLI